MTRKNETEYRIVSGGGKTLRVKETMSLPSDIDARDWLNRRWPGFQLQKKQGEEWVKVRDSA